MAVEQLERAATELAASGLLERLPDGMWRIGASADTQALEDLATAWATCRPAVLRTLTGRAVGRIRASAARAFADAFRLRRPKDDGENDG